VIVNISTASEQTDWFSGN